MKIEITKDKEHAQAIREALKENNGFCPCVIEQSADTKCICKDFKENVAVGEYCHCGLYKKIAR